MQKEILAIVGDLQQWQGNSYTLATLIAEHVKECAALKCDDIAPEIAEQIRGM